MRTETALAASRDSAYSAALMLTGSQIRAARALLGWTSQKLADESGVHYATISRCEQQDSFPNVRVTSLRAIQMALEAGGIEFIEGNYTGTGGPGVRLKSSP